MIDEKFAAGDVMLLLGRLLVNGALYDVDEFLAGRLVLKDSRELDVMVEELVGLDVRLESETKLDTPLESELEEVSVAGKMTLELDLLLELKVVEVDEEFDMG
jgi:hypothetical protein